MSEAAATRLTVRRLGGKCGTLSKFLAIEPGLRQTGCVAESEAHLVSMLG
jgi:hypothetical protein